MNEYLDMPDLAADFLKNMRSIQNRSIATIKEYYYDLKNIFKYLKYISENNNILETDIEKEKIDETNIAKIDLSFIKQISLEDLENYFYYLTEYLKIKPISRARKVASIKTFFNYLCVKKKLLNINPCIGLESPKIPKTLPKYLKLEEATLLLHSIDGAYKTRDYAIITLFLNCGLRLAELVSIDINSIRGDTLTVMGKGNKERSVHLNNACIKAINTYLKDRPCDNLKDRKALFISKQHTRIGRRNVELLVKKFIIQAGLDPTKYTPHKLRHTAATLMHKHGGVDIRALQQILGHQSLSTTEIYTHIDSEDVRLAIDSNPLNNI